MIRSWRFLSVLAAFCSAASLVGASDAWTHMTKEENSKLPGNEIQFLGPLLERHGVDGLYMLKKGK